MRRPSPRIVLAAALVLVVAAIAVVLAVGERGPQAPPPAQLPPPPNRIVPDAFVARLATEALGEAPDQDAWRAAGTYFHERGCTPATIAAYARRIYTGDDYAALRYGAPERAITLYAGLLAREPDAEGVAHVKEAMQSDGAWPGLVDAMLGSAEFTKLAPAICDPATPAYAPAAAATPVDVGAGGDGFTGDQAALQAALDAAPPGATVRLAQRALVPLSSPLRIPRGVTLTTTGDPGVGHYASMGRLVRTGAPADGAEPSIVDLADGATLRNVWVSGGRAWIGTPKRAAVTVRIRGDGATVSDAKIADPLGGSSVFVSTTEYGGACTTATVRDNLITGYGTEHGNGNWADGISVACPRTSVTGNAIVDATDVGIVLYRVIGQTQASVVEHNRIIAAGRSAFAALAADPLMDGDGRPFSFEGARVQDNELWTGERTHFDIGLAVGTRPWFGDRANKGTGAAFIGNTSGALSLRTTNAFAVDGMLDATVRDNTLRAAGMEGTACPVGPSAERTGGWASGSIQEPFRDQSLSGCIPLEK